MKKIKLRNHFMMAVADGKPCFAPPAFTAIEPSDKVVIRIGKKGNTDDHVVEMRDLLDLLDNPAKEIRLKRRLAISRPFGPNSMFFIDDTIPLDEIDIYAVTLQRDLDIIHLDEIPYSDSVVFVLPDDIRPDEDVMISHWQSDYFMQNYEYFKANMLMDLKVDETLQYAIGYGCRKGEQDGYYNLRRIDDIWNWSNQHGIFQVDKGECSEVKVTVGANDFKNQLLKGLRFR